VCSRWEQEKVFLKGVQLITSLRGFDPGSKDVNVTLLKSNCADYDVEDNFNYIIADVMSKDLIGVAPDSTARDAANTLIENKINSLVVKENGRVIGIVTDRDFAIKTADGKKLDKIKVKDMMSKELITVDPNLSLREAAEVIREHNIRHLLVKSKAKEFVGLVSVKDILSTLFEELKDQNTKLNKKIEELEKFYKVAVNRELIMVKLKKRIHELEERVGEKVDIAEYLVE
jgi:CBS domain-containing protein